MTYINKNLKLKKNGRRRRKVSLYLCHRMRRPGCGWRCQDGDFIGDSDDDDDFNECDSDGTDDTATEDTANCYTSEVNPLRAPVQSSALEQ